MTRKEMESVLSPDRYTGRCAEQVSRYVQKIRKLLTDVPKDQAEINL